MASCEVRGRRVGVLRDLRVKWECGMDRCGAVVARLPCNDDSMWRDVAMSNTAPLADTLLALEQRLAHLRENLKTPELREEFSRANRFRSGTNGATRKD